MTLLLNNEEVKALVTLTGNGKTIENIKGKLYFPASLEGPVRIELDLQPEELPAIMKLQDVTFISVEAICSFETYVSKDARIIKSTIGSSVYTENKAMLSVYNVKRIVTFPKKNKKKHSNIIFWLNNDAVLPLGSYIEPSFDGNVKLKEGNKELTKFSFSDKLSFEFKNIYHYKYNDNGYTAYSHKVCEVNTDKEIISDVFIQEIITKVEEFLLLASFGYDNRIVWLGYEYHNKNEYHEFYRGSFQSCKHKRRIDPLSDIGLFVKEFIAESYPKFTSNSMHYNAIKRAIYALCNDQEAGIIDDKFLELFSSFEGILLAYNKISGSEQLLDSDTFIEVKEVIKNSLNVFCNSHGLEKTVMKKIVEKIPELNRPSLRNTLKRFKKEYDLPIHLFWPFFTTEEKKPGLSDIRNKLIHGDILYGKYEYLGLARHQLRIILIISIIKVLEWPLDKTRYTEGSIKRICHYYPDILQTAQTNWKLNAVEEKS